MMVTTDSKLMVCGNSKGNRFCEKDYEVNNIYNIKRLQNIKKDLINDLKIASITTSDFHSLALTQDGQIYVAALAGQTLLYALAAAGGLGLSHSRVCALTWYFVLVNVATGVAFLRFLRGHKQVLWQPRHGA